MKFSSVLKEEKIVIKETKISIILNRAKLQPNDPKRKVLDDSSNVGTIQDENGQLMDYDSVDLIFKKNGLNLENYKTVAGIARQQSYYVERDAEEARLAAEKRKAIDTAKASGNLALNPLRADFRKARS